MWINGILQLDVQRMIWQQDINSYPNDRFYISWMWGGTEQGYLPLATFREYFGDARMGITSRSNALANPWPF